MSHGVRGDETKDQERHALATGGTDRHMAGLGSNGRSLYSVSGGSTREGGHDWLSGGSSNVDGKW